MRRKDREARLLALSVEMADVFVVYHLVHVSAIEIIISYHF